MPVVGDKLEQLIPKEESKPRKPQAQEPLVATKIVQDIPDKVFADKDNKIPHVARKIQREQRVSIPLKGEVHKSRSKAKILNYTPKQKKQEHSSVAPEFRMTDQEKENIKQRIFKMRNRLGV